MDIQLQRLLRLALFTLDCRGLRRNLPSERQISGFFTHPKHDQAILGSRHDQVNAAIVSFSVNPLLVLVVSAVIFTNILKSNFRLFQVKIIHVQCFDLLSQFI